MRITIERQSAQQSDTNAPRGAVPSVATSRAPPSLTSVPPQANSVPPQANSVPQQSSQAPPAAAPSAQLTQSANERSPVSLPALHTYEYHGHLNDSALTINMLISPTGELHVKLTHR